MAKRLPKIELTLLKKLVGELETALAAAQELPTEKDQEVHEFITAIAKTSGLAAGVAQEAKALVNDMYQVSRFAQQPAVDLFGGLADLLGGPGGDDKTRN